MQVVLEYVMEMQRQLKQVEQHLTHTLGQQEVQEQQLRAPYVLELKQ